MIIRSVVGRCLCCAHALPCLLWLLLLWFHCLTSFSDAMDKLYSDAVLGGKFSQQQTKKRK